MNRQLKFKAIYENKLHDVYGISFPELIVKIPLHRFPFTQDVKAENKQLKEEIVRKDSIIDKCVQLSLMVTEYCH